MSVGGIGGSNTQIHPNGQQVVFIHQTRAYQSVKLSSLLCEPPQPHASVHRYLSPTAHHPPPSALTMSEAAPPTDSRQTSMSTNTHHSGELID